METTQNKPRGASNYVALVLAIVALVLSLRPYIFRDRVEWPGVSFVRFLDSNSDEPIGFMRAEYGALTIGHFRRKDGSVKDLNRLELRLRDDGLLIELQEHGVLVGKWSLTKDTDTLTRVGGEADP